MKILLTGFTPFGEVKVNPSQLIVEAIAQQGNFAELFTEILPVEYGTAGGRISQLIREVQPDAIVCVGVAQGREAICLERVALNLNDGSIPDNAGHLISGKPITADGPVGYWSTLPLERMEQALVNLEIPVNISNHAGAYLCNHVFFCARHELECEHLNIPCGFIHVPSLREAGSEDSAGLPLDRMVKGIEACLECLSQS